jgi:two-component system, OmpR family, response regulator RegX3
MFPVMEQMPHILVVDDDREIRDLLARFLEEKHRMRVTAVRDAREARRAFANGHYHIVVLDLMLPGEGGLDFARWLRTQSDTPIVMLTAMGEETDRIIGLELGADDYLPKPFNPRELLARIRAVLRRRAEPEDSAASVLEAGPVRMDVDRHVVSVGGSVVQLPLKEFELLEFLLRNAGRVLTRGQLIDRVWGADYVGDTKTLDVHVTRLRAKIEDDPRAPRLLLTVRGLGYRLEG